MKPQPAPANVAIEMSVRVTDGSYESRLAVPVNASPETHKHFAEMWLGALAEAIKLTAPQREEQSK